MSISSYLNKNWKKFENLSLIESNFLKLGDEALKQRCSKVWDQASNSVFSFFLIGPGMRKDSEKVRNFGLLAIGDEYYPEYKGAQLQRGAIFGSKPWFTLLNDIFIFSGIMQEKQFHIPYDNLEKIPEKRLWDEEKDQLTAFGREIIFLALAEYQYITIKGMNICFIPTKKPEISNLLRVQKKTKEISSYEQLKKLLLNLQPFQEKILT
ncbi:MAG: hypothetical protein K1000chlam3_00169 [Chlamydiae bacterium]|nr:hypothetical protein [Chlamydiota bacterium]